MFYTHGEITRWEEADGGDGRVVQVVSQQDEITIREQATFIELGFVESGFNSVVTVYKSEKMFGTEQPARVNWSALGTQPVNVAMLMAKCLYFAADIAKQINEAPLEGWE